MKSPARSPVASSRGRPFDRHSGTGTRGLPKKKGAGGKGVWGAAMDQDGGVAYLDKNDPNYDSDGQDDSYPPQFDLSATTTTTAAATATATATAVTPPATDSATTTNPPPPTQGATAAAPAAQ
eukprot:GFKZ01005901.1.p1 GENE.GFKZ01005901.1~~GFKZ01005901.1.p1  ORF type:complete len:123 (+),score=21.04 GFKZ01005901.1:258-626(+)